MLSQHRINQLHKLMGELDNVCLRRSGTITIPILSQMPHSFYLSI